MIRGVKWKTRDVIRVNRVSNKAASSVRVNANHEKECEVVGVPKRFKALLADFVLSGGIHQEHDEE